MKKKLFAVYYAGSLGMAMQPVKADTAEQAKDKFIKKHPKYSEVINDAEELEPTSPHYKAFRKQSF